MGKYFRHSKDAGESELLDILLDYGAEGYTAYWLLCEVLMRRSGSIEADYKKLSVRLRFVSEEVIKHVVEDYRLFDVKEGMIHSKLIDDEIRLQDESLKKKMNC